MHIEQSTAQTVVGQGQNPMFLKPTKSCWLTLEAIVLASCVIVEGMAVISAALRPKIPKAFIQIVEFHQDCTQISMTLYHSVFPQSIPVSASTCTPHSQHQCHHCVYVEPPCAGSPH